MVLVKREKNRHQTGKYWWATEIFAGLEGLLGKQMVETETPESFKQTEEESVGPPRGLPVAQVHKISSRCCKASADFKEK